MRSGRIPKMARWSSRIAGGGEILPRRSLPMSTMAPSASSTKLTSAKFIAGEPMNASLMLQMLRTNGQSEKAEEEDLLAALGGT